MNNAFRWFLFFYFFLGGISVFSAMAQKHRIGLNFQIQTKYIKTDLETSESARYRFEYDLSNVTYYSLDYERDFDRIICDFSINFSTIDFKYNWTYGSGFGDGGPNGASMSSTAKTEEILRSKFNFIGFNFLTGVRVLKLDNPAFRFYFFLGIGLDYPVYISTYSQFREIKTSSYDNPNYGAYNLGYFDTTYYSNENSSFNTRLLTSLPLGIRYRFNVFKRVAFDINFGLRPQLSGLSINKNFQISNGLFFGAAMLVPLGKQKE